MAEKTAAELQKENAELRAALEKAKGTGIVSPPVPGTFKADCPGPDGKTVTKKFKFKNGRTSTPIKFGDNIGFTVPSHMLIALANGTKRDKIEGLDKIETLRDTTQEDAQLELEYLVEINAATIEEVK